MDLKDYLTQNMIRFKENEPMNQHTTFRIGGPAKLFIAPGTVSELTDIIAYCRKNSISFTVIGRGSNLLVPDEGLDITVISTAAMTGICFNGNTVTAECGVSLAALSTAAAERGLSGLEFAHGIPGTVGGAVFMNAGAYGGEISQILTESSCFSPAGIVTLPGEKHSFAYRSSFYKNNTDHLILSATFKLESGKPETIKEKMRGFDASRREKQPLEFPSAGSAYKRPAGYFAGKLIEDCGLKGFTVGGAAVSEKHAGFIINKGGATCKDVLTLMDHIEKTVFERFNVKLEREIKVAEG